MTTVTTGTYRGRQIITEQVTKLVFVEVQATSKRNAEQKFRDNEGVVTGEDDNYTHRTTTAATPVHDIHLEHA